MIFQLIYISYNRIPAKDLDKEVDQIIQSSKESNHENDISGILLFRDHIFMQLLEGDKDKVLQTYGKICADKRHYKITTLASQYTDQRIFEIWSMGIHKISQEDLTQDIFKAVINPYLDSQDKCYELMNPSRAKKLFKDFSFYRKSE